jgi:hypothetical protein
MSRFHGAAELAPAGRGGQHEGARQRLAKHDVDRWPCSRQSAPSSNPADHNARLRRGYGRRTCTVERLPRRSSGSRSLCSAERCRPNRKEDIERTSPPVQESTVTRP